MHTDRDTDRETVTERQTGRQTETERQTDSETDRSFITMINVTSAIFAHDQVPSSPVVQHGQGWIGSCPQ